MIRKNGATPSACGHGVGVRVCEKWEAFTEKVLMLQLGSYEKK